MHITFKKKNFYLNSSIITPYMNCSICNKQDHLFLEKDVLIFLQKYSRGIIILNKLSKIKYKISTKKYKLKIKEINNNISKILVIYNIIPDCIWININSYLDIKDNYFVNQELDYLIYKLNTIFTPNRININLFCNKCKYINEYSNCLFCYNYELLNRNHLCIKCSYLIKNYFYNSINNIIL